VSEVAPYAGTISVLLDGRAASVGQARVLTFPERFARRDWGEDWPIGLWGNPVGSYCREYLAPVFAKASSGRQFASSGAGFDQSWARIYCRNVQSYCRILLFTLRCFRIAFTVS